MSITNITSLQSLLDSNNNTSTPSIPIVLLCYASWHEPSCEGGEVYAVLQTLEQTINSSGNDKLKFVCVDAEQCLDISKKYNVTVVPTLCLLDSKYNLIQRLDGCGTDGSIADITQAVKHLADNSTATNTTSTTATATTTTTSEEVVKEEQQETSLNDKLKRLINTSDVMLFMKGDPSGPRCGFSRQAVEMLSGENIAFGSFDILSDEDVRQGLKTYSDWPTYPQLYVHGELIGGLDILKEMKEDSSSSLAEQLGVSPSEETEVESLDDRLKKLINKHRIMLFMKGLPSRPFCGFSKQIVEILDKHEAKYGTFNILDDDEIRQGLKIYSDWPTYPQLYVEGDLIGGLDIIKEMDESSDLIDLLKGNQTD